MRVSLLVWVKTSRTWYNVLNFIPFTFIIYIGYEEICPERKGASSEDSLRTHGPGYP